MITQGVTAYSTISVITFAPPSLITESLVSKNPTKIRMNSTATCCPTLKKTENIFSPYNESDFLDFIFSKYITFPK